MNRLTVYVNAVVALATLVTAILAFPRVASAWCLHQGVRALAQALWKQGPAWDTLELAGWNVRHVQESHASQVLLAVSGRKLQQAIRWDGDNDIAYETLAQVYLFQGDYLAAAEVLAGYAVRHPEDREKALKLATIYQALDAAWQVGTIEATKYETLEEEIFLKWQSVGLTVQDFIRAGDEARRQQRYGEASQWYRRAARWEPALAEALLLPVPASGAYGKIKGGDESHPDEVMFIFEGQPGDMMLSYRVWDIDGEGEVDILLNDERLANVAATDDEGWSGVRTLVLEDAKINDGMPNTLVFNAVSNPPNAWWWGVRDVRIVEAIPLPASGAYGKIKGGDESHPDEVVFTFEGQPGNVILSYQVWDIDTDSEVDILLNDEWIADVGVTGDEMWSEVRTLVLGDAGVRDGELNRLTFDAAGNPPNTWWWGVRQVSIE